MTRNINQTILAVTVLAFLAGCAVRPEEIGRAPALSPVAANLGMKNNPQYNGYPVHPGQASYSLWNQRSTNFFRDPRAAEPGDVLTVVISINDRANLDNKTDRERVSKGIWGAGGAFSTSSFSGASAGGDMDASVNTHSDSKSKGKGTIERSEEIRLQVAAIVTDTLPNGNMVIRGSQEVRVNNELRVLNVVGVVRPRDISGSNTISYDKIAEARISYGGRGRLSEIQQPPYGQQILDQVSPF
ncbi:flagellar basal body L-ring protein FlgH [Falsochrobactrum sp. TDYN1]|uniref:Flagellar L-ring protein n=1 Tax=Falsochrobactrum tianjinense TaxID=2706015 RepID=A0A949PT01_9HYPH|nr:flagellar basal body L-ring protein FlgH [Falsochrobactrum sp. TDYN1]MBV2144335.1 flagellar basal body L-ring protein FlgH [Falsochrobactrum sp. TDYN1]